jgi:hypothetical protein
MSRGDGQASALPKNERSEVPDLVDVIAERVAARVLERLQRDGQDVQRPALLDVTAVARLLGVSDDYVRAHRDELGVVRLPGAPLRFDAVVVADLMVSRCCSEKPQKAGSPAPPDVSAGRRRRSGATPDLLPIKGSAS